MGYIPNATAQNLRKQSSRLVGIFVDALDYETTSETIACLHAQLAEQNYMTIICNVGGSAEKEAHYYQMMCSMNACAIVLMVNRFTEAPAISYGIPVIYIYRSPVMETPDENCCALVTDDYSAGYQAGAALVDMGCTRVAEVRLISSDDRLPLWRHMGLLHAIYDHNAQYEEALSVVSQERSFHQIFAQVDQKLRTAPAADGYFCTSDLLALALIRALEQHHYRIPEDVRVIGCNDMAISLYNNKPISTIRHRIPAICREAVRLIDRMTRGEQLTAEERKQTFGVDLVLRGTT